MSAPMTPDREQEIRAREQAATPGPWEECPSYGKGFYAYLGGSYLRGVGTLEFGDGEGADADRAFTLHARQDVPALLAEVVRLQARVAELEAARTTAAADRDKQIIAWLEKKAREEGTSNKDSRVRATATYRLADKLSRGAVRPACPPVSPEDPHDSPLHHSYALGRDLPEVDPARCLDTHPFSPRDGWRLICGSCDHAEGAPCHRGGGAL